MIERILNRTRQRPPYHVSEDVRRIHNRLTIVDLHADSLLWNRDLLVRSSSGHVDLPRLSEGNVAIQVFGVVTQLPPSIRLNGLSLYIDPVTLLSLSHKWPRQTRANLPQRAIYQSQRLADSIHRSDGKMMLIRSVKDLDHVLRLRKTQPGFIGAILCLEGAHALGGKLTNLRKLYEASFRMLGISHFADNEAAGSAHGRDNHGLTAFGYEMIAMLQELHMVLDLAHASGRVIDEVTEVTRIPVIASHTGVRGTCDNPRNLSDSQIKKIAKSGGVIGIAMFGKAVCGTQVGDTARAMRYVADLVGVEHVGFGSDFDGAINAPVDTSGLPLLTEALLAQGFDETEIGKIMGGNALRVLREVLPKE